MEASNPDKQQAAQRQPDGLCYDQIKPVMTLGDLLWGAVGGSLRPGKEPDGTDVATVTPVQQLGKAADA